MKGIILLNGEPYRGVIEDSGAVVYCCDGAYAWAKGRLHIDKNVGDYDSLNETPFPPPEEIYPVEKNYTDGEMALFKLLKEGVDEIEIYGGGGGREDHFLGNLHLLYLAHSAGVKCKMCNNGAVLFPVGGRVELGGHFGKTISVLPFGGVVHIINYRGLKYDYPEALHYGECRGISNIVLSRDAFLEVRGKALLIINEGIS